MLQSSKQKFYQSNRERSRSHRTCSETNSLRNFNQTQIYSSLLPVHSSVDQNLTVVQQVSPSVPILTGELKQSSVQPNKCRISAILVHSIEEISGDCASEE